MGFRESERGMWREGGRGVEEKDRDGEGERGRGRGRGGPEERN